MHSVDFIIVGQGIAGTLLAHELEKRRQSFVVIDSGADSASLTAAGMLNPVVLKRFSPVWQGRAQIRQARETFVELSVLLNKKLFYPFETYRIFNNVDESNTWENKATLPALDGLLDTALHPSPNPAIIAPYGMGKVNLCGRMDLATLLGSYRHRLEAQGQFIHEAFDHTQLTIAPSSVGYKGIAAKAIVFCEGYGIKQNPLFNYLPLNGNKGEVLTVNIPHLNVNAALKSGVFIMPLPDRGDHSYFIGATYNWTDKDTVPTQAGQAQLLNKLEKMLSPEAFKAVEITEHRAGIRPTVSDRRPLLGRHPFHPHVLLMNGLGTRGVMLGATAAKWLTAHILDAAELPEAVDIARFQHLSEVV